MTLSKTLIAGTVAATALFAGSANAFFGFFGPWGGPWSGPFGWGGYPYYAAPYYGYGYAPYYAAPGYGYGYPAYGFPYAAPAAPAADADK